MILKLSNNSEQIIRQSASALKKGQLIAVPTETVYGIAADASNAQAIARLFAVKHRADSNPVQIIVSSLAQATLLGDFNEDALVLAKKYWPGGLTLVVHRNQSCTIDSSAFCGRDTIGIRIPNHPFIQNLASEFGEPIALSSANISGESPCTNAKTVHEIFKDDLPLIIDDGESEIGMSSTVIDCTKEYPTILRHGKITESDIKILLQSNN